MNVKGFSLVRLNNKKTTAVSISTVTRAKFDPEVEYRTYDLPPDTKIPPKTYLVPRIDTMLTACVTSNASPFRPHPRQSGPRAKNVIHPSSAGGCLRAVQFDLMGVKKDPVDQIDTRMQRIFAMGHMAHERLQGYLFECWRRSIGGVTRVWEDVALTIPRLKVSGELDCVVEIDYAHRYLVEIKTINKSGFDKLSVPQAKWVTQARLYMAALGLKAAILLVECRDDGSLKEFFVPWCAKTFQEMEYKFVGLQDNVKTGKMAPMTTNAGDCYFCDKKVACERVNKEGTKWLKST